MSRFMILLVLVAALFMGLRTAGSEELASREKSPWNPLASDSGRDGGIRLVQAATSSPQASYSDVAAIVEKYHCTVCHAGPEPREGLGLDSYDNMMKGGEDGPVVVPGAPGKSELVQRVKGTKEPRMPMTGPPWLSEGEVKIIEDWISAGARGPKS